MKLLTGLPRNGDYVFSGKQGKPLRNMAMLEMMRGMRGKGETVHGLRSSFKDWATESGYADEVSEAALDHRGAGGKVRAAYARSDLFEQRRELMDKWAEFAMSAPRVMPPRDAPLNEAALEVHRRLSEMLLRSARQSS